MTTKQSNHDIKTIASPGTSFVREIKKNSCNMIDEISDKIDDTIDEFWSLDLNDADSKDKDEVIRLLRKAVIRNDSAEPSGKISKQQTNDTQDESGTSHTDDLKTTTKQSD